MKRLYLILLVGILVLSGCDQQKGISVRDAWVRTAMQGDNGAVYFTMQNHTASADELTGVSTGVAEAVEMHGSQMDGDVMKMRPITSIPFPEKSELEFGPGGLHVMLIRLKQDLKVGDEIQVTFHFKNFEDITLNIPVQENGDGDAMENH